MTEQQEHAEVLVLLGFKDSPVTNELGTITLPVFGKWDVTPEDAAAPEATFKLQVDLRDVAEELHKLADVLATQGNELARAQGLPER